MFHDRQTREAVAPPAAAHEPTGFTSNDLNICVQYGRKCQLDTGVHVTYSVFTEARIGRYRDEKIKSKANLIRRFKPGPGIDAGV